MRYKEFEKNNMEDYSVMAKESNFAMGLEFALLIESLRNSVDFYEKQIEIYRMLNAINSDAHYKEKKEEYKLLRKRKIEEIIETTREVKEV